MPESEQQLKEHIADLIHALERAIVAMERPHKIAYTIDEAAAALGVSPDMIRGQIKRGRIKSRLVGKRRLISAETLKKLVM